MKNALESVVELIFPVHVMGATRELTLEGKQAGGVVGGAQTVPFHHQCPAVQARDY